MALHLSLASLGRSPCAWLARSFVRRKLDRLFSLNDKQRLSKNRLSSPFLVPPTIHKVAVEMNLSDSCFLELKPESLGKGEPLACLWRTVR